jgi:hypothetical protein
MTGRPCTQTLPDGRPCRGFATTGSEYCFAHDPARALQRSAAQRAGGKAPRGRSLPKSAVEVAPDPVAIRSNEDLLVLVETTINDLRTGRLDPRVSNAVGYLANVAVKILEQTEIETRLDALEAVLDPERQRAVALRRRS